MKKLILVLIILLNLNTKLITGEIYGSSVVTDGDTIKILHNKIRLYGIDAPERNQKCIKNKKLTVRIRNAAKRQELSPYSCQNFR